MDTVLRAAMLNLGSAGGLASDSLDDNTRFRTDGKLSACSAACGRYRQYYG